MNLQKVLENARMDIIKKYGNTQVTETTADFIINSIINNEKVVKRINKIKSGERDMEEFLETTSSIASKNHDLTDIEYSYIDFKELLITIFDLNK